MKRNIWILNIKESDLKDVDILCALFYLYEFTDEILFLAQNTPNYPNIFNFVKTGLLTEEEAYEGLLHKNR